MYIQSNECSDTLANSLPPAGVILSEFDMSEAGVSVPQW